MSNIRIGHMTLGIYQTNCYFVYRENSDKVLVFDPADHGEKIEEALGQHGLHTAAILLTHGHFDHIGGCEELKAAADAYAGEHGENPVKIYAGEAEKKFLLDTKSNLSKDMGRPVTVTADVYLKARNLIWMASGSKFWQRPDILQAVSAIISRREGS